MRVLGLDKRDLELAAVLLAFVNLPPIIFYSGLPPFFMLAMLPALTKRKNFKERSFVMATVWTFFYGSYMDVQVLAEVDLIPERVEVASLQGFDIVIAPPANLKRSQGCCVYGVVAKVTHAELERLYAHARDVLGGTYYPEPVVVDTENGRQRPALCYIAPSIEPRPADNDYIDRIVGPARKLGFPEAYIQHLESFRR